MSLRAAKTLHLRLYDLALVSDDPRVLTRTFLSPAMRRANALVGEWMKAAGLAVREDATGNLIGRLEGPAPGARTLVLGSHLDTVRDAGRYDGALGVLLAIAAVAEVRRRGWRLPFALEVLGFSEEEGVRFASAYLGSKGYTGQLRPSDLAQRDTQGQTVGEVLTRHGGAPFQLPAPAHEARELLGYLEVHIEQGPVLEAARLAVGVVTGIAGQTRGRIVIRGRAGHAGTTPMTLRRDALAGTAEVVLLAESLARANPPLVATIGTLGLMPGAPNVIPSVTVLSLDLRHPEDRARRRALREFLAGARAIARRRKLSFSWELTQDNGAVGCGPDLTSLLEESVKAVQRRSLRLVSGAGHDAVVMSALTPVAMLFVRCRDGLSHHPDEFASAADMEVALQVTIDFLQRLAARESTR